MDFKLSEGHLELQRRVREWCEREVAPRSKEFDVKEEFPWPLMDGLRRLGLLGIIFPAEYGGQAIDTLGLVVILEELGRADASLALLVESHNGLCSNHIFLAGNEAQKRKYLSRLARGEVLGAWALTEPGAGSDAQSIKTTAVFDGTHWTINGSKTFTTQGSVAGVYVVMARTVDPETGKPGMTAFVMEKGTPGLEVGKKEKKMGLHASDTAQVHLSNVRVPAEQVLGTPGRAFRDVMKVLDAGRVAISGISVGIARASLEQGVAWVKERKTEFRVEGEPGLSAAGKLLADLATEVDAARLLAYRAAVLVDRGERFTKEASMAKLMSGDLAMKAPTVVLDLLGLPGATLDSPVQRYFRDAKLYQIGEGSSQIQELIISRHLLAE